MTTFTGSPRLIKGSIVGMDLTNPAASVVVFQYNPHTLTRSLKPRASGGEGDKSEAYRLEGPPQESIKVDIEIDAADQLEKGDINTTLTGIYPQLSALEMLIYPKSARVIANTLLLAAGTIEVIPPDGPFTIFIWGPQRVLPVRLTDMSITEEAHDARLNPIRAKVNLGMTVLSYNDLPISHPGYSMFLSHQVMKEAMAETGSSKSLGGFIG